MWCWIRGHKQGLWGVALMNKENDCYQVRTCVTCGKVSIRWVS